jgi:hypothetical protein
MPGSSVDRDVLDRTLRDRNTLPGDAGIGFLPLPMRGEIVGGFDQQDEGVNGVR